MFYKEIKELLNEVETADKTIKTTSRELTRINNQRKKMQREEAHLKSELDCAKVIAEQGKEHLEDYFLQAMLSDDLEYKVFVLKYIKGYTHDQIAYELNYSVLYIDQISSRINRKYRK